MNTTEPQPDPSPAQREEPTLTVTQDGSFVLLDAPVRIIARMECKHWTPQDRADAQRLVNGWNALPLLDLTERALLEAQDEILKLAHKFERAGGIWKVAERGVELGSASWASNVENAINNTQRILESALTAIRESKGK